ncbi:MAG: hypothetical protein ABH822_01820 [Patescibacteria group bacterium]
MSIKKFLLWGGWLFLVLGALGFLLGNLWAPTWNFTYGENLAHVVVGLVLLVFAYKGKSADLMKWLTILVGLVALYFSFYGFAVSTDYYGMATLEGLDNLIHLAIGVWALWVVWGKKKK